MPERSVVVASKVGLHARPAALLAKAAAETGLAVTITADGRGPVDARSVLALMTLGAQHGETVTISADGEGADAALERLADLVSSELDGD